jgi:hypothetical protein
MAICTILTSIIIPAFAFDTWNEGVVRSELRYRIAKDVLTRYGPNLGFESGHPDTGWGWGNIEYYGKSLSDPSQRETERNRRLLPVESPVIEGSRSLKVTVYPNDPQAVHGGARSEVSTEDNIYFKNGDNVWYRWYTFFPEDLVVPNSWHVWTQWHQLSGFSVCRITVNYAQGEVIEKMCPAVPLGFNLRNYGDSRGERVEFEILDKRDPQTPGRILWHKQFNDQDFRKGVWHEFLLHVVWGECVSMDYTIGTCRDDPQIGFQELWVDGVKQQFIESAHHYNLDDYEDHTISDPIKKELIEDNAVYMKQGLYHCYWQNPNCPSTPIQTIYHDGMEFFICGQDVTRDQIIDLLRERYGIRVPFGPPVLDPDWIPAAHFVCY